jgi:hypothetical protein
MRANLQTVNFMICFPQLYKSKEKKERERKKERKESLMLPPRCIMVLLHLRWGGLFVGNLNDMHG